MTTLPFFALLLLSTPSFADGGPAGKLAQFLDETEELVDDASSGLDRAAGSSGELRALGGDVKAFKEQARRAMAEVNKELGDPSCRLPRLAKIAAADSDLNELIADAQALKERVRKERVVLSHKAYLRSAASGNPEQGFGLLSRSLARAETDFGFYAANLAELRGWLHSTSVGGLTSEVIARNPKCAGRVVASAGLLPKVDGAADAPASSAEMPILRIDIKQIPGGGYSAQ